MSLSGSLLLVSPGLIPLGRPKSSPGSVDASSSTGTHVGQKMLRFWMSPAAFCLFTDVDVVL
jgi:hypothetical protein